MNKILLSIRAYIGLIVCLSLLAAVSVFMPQGEFMKFSPEQPFPASKPILAVVYAGIILFVYGGLGFIGLILSQKLGYADIWEPKVSNRQRFFIPALYGMGLGLVFIIADAILSRFHGFGPLPHPPFPTSLVASAVAGIGEEIIFRLFFISFWVWLISHVILKKKWQNQIFWIFAVISAIVFAFAHIPSVLILFGMKSFSELPPAIWIEIFFLNGMISLVAAYQFKNYGFLAAVGIHFWTDVVWHVIWGFFS